MLVVRAPFDGMPPKGQPYVGWFTRIRLYCLLGLTGGGYGLYRLYRYAVYEWNFRILPEPKVPCVWRNDPDAPVKGPVPRINVNFPSCILAWRNESAAAVRESTLAYKEAFAKSGKAESVCKAGQSLGFFSKREPFHQPHFAGQYFFYLSLVLWQDFIFDGASCLRHFLVEEESVDFWGRLLEDQRTWPNQIIAHMNQAVAVNHVVSTTCALEKHKVQLLELPRRHDWFIHASDAFWLGATILRERDPCKAVTGTRAARQGARQLQFTMLQRGWARRLLNVPEVTTSLGRSKLTATFNVSVVNFEDSPVAQQVEAIRSSDVVLSVHGAGFTNIAFLRPCAIAIEIVPFALGVPPNAHYFGVLARSVGALHYTWVAEQQNSPLIPDALLDGGYDCKPIYNKLPSDVYKGFNACYLDRYCRACCKLTAISVNTTRLDGVLAKALADRQTCLASHPLYA